MRTAWMIGAACLLSIGLLLAGGCGKAMAPKGCWTFNEGSGDVVKNAVGPNHGRIQGGLGRTDGKKGKAAAFDGKGYVLIASAPYLASAQYTFAAWVKLKDTGNYQYIVWRGGPVFPEDKECRNLDVWVTQEGTLSGILDYQKAGESRLNLVGSKKVADNQWHLVVCVNDGKTVRFYVDGKKDAEGALAGPLAGNDFPLWIGARPSDVAATGIIDEVKFFDRALTEKEVAELK
ncbi:MAG: LamG domain-containing protein [Planctomycetes bacterium]|nr:LamG domain-containing protein [Planctomycetota bacterium]